MDNINILPDFDPHVETHGSCVHQPERKSPRAPFHNYSGGEYFITVCTSNKKHYFGHINTIRAQEPCVRPNEMNFTPIGEYCHKQLESLPIHYPYATVPIFTVMPNHVHAIICINSNRTHEPCVPTERTALSVIIGGFKRAVTLFARRNSIEFAWQSRYHDHIIRNSQEGLKISKYIENNILNWANDCFY